MGERKDQFKLVESNMNDLLKDRKRFNEYAQALYYQKLGNDSLMQSYLDKYKVTSPMETVES